MSTETTKKVEVKLEGDAKEKVEDKTDLVSKHIFVKSRLLCSTIFVVDTSLTIHTQICATRLFFWL